MTLSYRRDQCTTVGAGSNIDGGAVGKKPLYRVEAAVRDGCLQRGAVLAADGVDVPVPMNT
jgi:hypothetical protein